MSPALCASLVACLALQPPATRPSMRSSRATTSTAKMQAGDFDLSKRTFDYLEQREFRRDTALIYGGTSRSEQLRIIFFTSSSLVAAGFPYIVGQLLPSAPPTDFAGVVVSLLSALGFGWLAWREKQARGRKLLRLERELSLGELSVCQPANAIRVGQKPIRLESLRNSKRVVVLCGTADVLLRAVRLARVYRRRLAQSGIVLIGVEWTEADSSSLRLLAKPSADERAWTAEQRLAQAEGWLWQPTDAATWADFYTELLGTRVEAAKSGDGVWLALSLQGRSCASGLGMPAFDELLGTKLPPLSELSADEAVCGTSTKAEEAVLAAQSRLYDALARVDADGVRALCVETDDGEVSELSANGRLDDWQVVLKYDATKGLQVASQDASVDADSRTAYSTAIEFPAAGGTLLCTQRWINTALSSDVSSADWRLAQHRTIPYAVNIDAPACLRCDHRGCVALQRSGVQGASGMPGDGRA